MKPVFPRFFSVVAATLGLTVGAAPSQATTISFFDTQTFVSSGAVQSSNGSPVNSTSHNGSYALQLFDSSLGTLNSVRLQINQSIDSTLNFGSAPCFPLQNGEECQEITREGDQSATYTAGATANAALASQLFFHVDLCSAPIVGTGTPEYALCNDGFAQSFVLQDDVLLTGAQTADFEGIGSFAVDANMFFQHAVSILTSGAGQSTDAHFSWAGTATVTYDYTAAATGIPVPAGASFLLIGLAALVRRRLS